MFFNQTWLSPILFECSVGIEKCVVTCSCLSACRPKFLLGYKEYNIVECYLVDLIYYLVYLCELNAIKILLSLLNKFISQNIPNSKD